MSRIELEHAVIQDGVMYKPGTPIPNLGNWTRTETDSNGRAHYEGVSCELQLLPHYVPHGSKAVCLDTGEIYTFHVKLNKWFKI